MALIDDKSKDSTGSVQPDSVTGNPGRVMKVVYRLKEDSESIARVQKATLNTRNFGIEPTHGLFGSAEWWEQISTGKLPLHTLRGVISQRYWGSMGDWPEVKVQSDAGEISAWTREANTSELDALYMPGQRIEIDYVIQRHRPKSFDHGAETKQVIEVRVEVDPRMQKLEHFARVKVKDLAQAVSLNFAVILDAARKLSELGDVPGAMSGEAHRVFIAIDREIQEQIVREKGANMAFLLESWKDRVLAACKDILESQWC